MGDELKLSAILGNALGTGAAVGVLLLILWRLVSRIAERSISALDGVRQEVNDHTKKDLEHHAEVRETLIEQNAKVREAVVRVEAKIDSALDWQERTPVTPVNAFTVDDPPAPPRRRDSDSERRRKQTAPHGYRPPKPGSHHDKDNDP